MWFWEVFESEDKTALIINYKSCSSSIWCTECDVTLGCYDPNGNGSYKCLQDNSGDPIEDAIPPGK